jgi:hypothetical protein
MTKIIRAPKELFYLWHAVWLEQCCVDCNSTQICLDARDALIYFSFGKGNPPLVTSILDDSVDKDITDKLAMWRDIAQEKYLSFQDMFKLIFVVSQSDSVDTNIFYQLMHNLTTFRRKYLAGIFPATDLSYCTGLASYLAEIIGLEQLDLLLMLTDGIDVSILDMEPYESQSYQQRCDQLDDAQHFYICAFNKAIEEGLPEFAVALLSLYIFLRTLMEKGRLGNLPDLMPAIERALTLPGAKILKHTLAFMVDSVDKYFSSDPVAVCSASYFRVHLPKSAEVHVIDGGAITSFRQANNEAGIKIFFENELGSDRWNRLSENSRKCLVSAELLWRVSAHEFGFGIKDWSGLINTYCKPIEGELVERLKAFYFSSEYATFLDERGQKRSAKPTAGWLLKELKSFSTMPAFLQDALRQSGTRLHEDTKLLNDLYDLVQNYRNIAAHPDAVSMTRFADFKKKLFQEKGLQRFIDAVC